MGLNVFSSFLSSDCCIIYILIYYFLCVFLVRFLCRNMIPFICLSYMCFNFSFISFSSFVFNLRYSLSSLRYLCFASKFSFSISQL